MDGLAIGLLVFGIIFILGSLILFFTLGKNAWAERELNKQKARTLNKSFWSFKGFWLYQKHMFYTIIAMVFLIVGITLCFYNSLYK